MTSPMAKGSPLRKWLPWVILVVVAVAILSVAAFGTRSYYYRVAAALNGNGLSPFSEVVTPGAIERAREPVADAFVKDGAFANTPQGGAAVCG